MPVLFDPSLLTVAKAQIKSATTALSGSIRITLPEYPENLKGFRMDMPFHLARAYIKREKSGDYLMPRHSEIIMYDGNPVGFEAFPYSAYKSSPWNEVQETIAKWQSRTRRALNNCIIPYLEDQDLLKWYIDGYVIYGLPDKEDWEADSIPLNSTGTFRRMRVPVFKLSEIAEGDTPIHNAANLMVERDCLIYKAPDNEMYITPPLWTNLGQVGSKKLDSTSTNTIDTELFDYIDDQLHVNIAFALDVAERITTLFGYEKAEPLQLPELMLEYQTVNLKRLPAAVKATAPCGIQFTHVLSWLFGIFKDPDCLNDMLTFRAILKTLTTRGLQVGDVMADSEIYQDGYTGKDITVMSFDEMESIRIGGDLRLPNVA